MNYIFTLLNYKINYNLFNLNFVDLFNNINI